MASCCKHEVPEVAGCKIRLTRVEEFVKKTNRITLRAWQGFSNLDCPVHRMQASDSDAYVT